MLEKIYIDEPRFTDLNMYSCGIEDCKSGHSWGPAVRDHYIIHYILGGKGTFTVGGDTYTLKKNDGFLICPGIIVHYKADESEPWSYAWVGFGGFKASVYLKQAGLDNNNLVFRYDRDSFLKDCLIKMIEARQLNKGKEIRLLGLLYEFLSQLVEVSPAKPAESSTQKEEYVKKALEYIKTNYHGKISISEIAGSIGLDRSYLYSLFIEYLGASPREYLIGYRMEKARELMNIPTLAIGDVSRSVGYDDPLAFSKAFKKFYGKSPREYRKNS